MAKRRAVGGDTRLGLTWPPLLLLLLAAVTPADAQGQAVLARLAESADWDRLSQQLHEGDAVNAAQPDGMTALHWSVFHGHHPTAQLLIRSGADVDAKTRYQVTPLVIACTLGHAELVADLLDAGGDVGQRQPGKETLLMLAARSGNPQSLRHLLRHGVPVDATERQGQTALMWAAAAGNAEAVDVLLAAGADPQLATDTGFTAMMFAARDGRREVVQHLLDAGVDIHYVMVPRTNGKRVPRKGTSALTLAVESGHFELAMDLVRRGADPNDQRSGYTPLHALSWVRKPNRGEEPDGDPPPRGSGSMTSLRFVRDMVAAGADVNARLQRGKGGKAVLNPTGATPLLLAAKTADLPLVALLVELGADPHRTNADGCTPLMAAAGIGVRAVGEEAGTEAEVLETLQFLIDQGLDVNAVDENRETAMHGAAYRCYPDVIRFLTAQGADPDVWNHKNDYGWTPVMIGQGHRPGSFKPSPPTVRALREALGEEAPASTERGP